MLIAQQQALRWVIVMALVPLLVLSACSRDEDKASKTPGPDSAVTVETPPSSESVDDKKTIGPLTASQLSPVIRESGYAGEVPEHILIQFYLPIASDSQINRKVDKDTVLQITPAVEGDLEFINKTTLRFTPKGLFDPQTEYKVVLKSVKAGNRVLHQPSPGAWSYSFRTPEFRFLRLSLRKVDRWANKIDLDLVMSGAVSLDSLRRYANWKVDGTAVSKVSYQRTARPNIIHASLYPGNIRIGKVEFTLAQGLSMVNKPHYQAATASAELVVPSGKPVKIYSVRIKEGASGYYVDVVCDDTAHGGRKRYYWNSSGRSYYVSRRCQLNESDARELIHFKPAVNFAVSPSGGGFRIIGNFSRGIYAMQIDGGARTVDGGVLQHPYEVTFTVPARSTKIQFVKKGRYLPRKAWRSLPVSHINASKVRILVRHIRQKNLVFWMSGHSERATERTSDLVLSTEVPLHGKPDVATTSWINIGNLLPDIKQGVFEITLQAGRSRDTARLLLTDMNLIAKQSRRTPNDPFSREVMVWAFDAHTNSPRSGVNMRLITKSNRTVAQCSTNSSGACLLRVKEIGVDKTAPFAILARDGDDVTYIKFNELKLAVSNEAVAGENYASKKAYFAAIYSDRGVYRPGDMLHLVGVIRGRNHMAPETKLPVKLKILDPRGKVMKQAVLKTNIAGIINYDMSFADFAATGQYRAKVFIAEQEIGSYKFSVEEFVPERMKVKAGTRKTAYHIKTTATVDVHADYLFGGSAAGSKVELTCELMPSIFKPRQNAHYYYGVHPDKKGDTKSVALGTVTGNLDRKGSATLKCPSPKQAISFQGAARLKVQAAVFEAGSGRTTTNQAYAAVHPEKFYIGLLTSVKKARVGQAVNIKGLVVDWDGNPVKQRKRLKVEFFQLDEEYGYFYDPRRRRERWMRVVHPRRVGQKQILVRDGAFEIKFTPTMAASGYLVRVTGGQARTDLDIKGTHRYYYWASSSRRVDATPRPLKPTALAIEAPLSTNVNSKTTIRFKAPYKGRALFTVETNKVLIADWRDVSAGETSWSFKLDKFVPNVYVSVLLVKDPHLDSKIAYMPDRAFGVKNIRIEPVAFKQTVTIKAPREVAPGKILTINLKVNQGKNSYVTVAAVDEGILSLTKFRNPDPIKQIFFRRALGINTFETVGWMLLIPPSGPSRHTGGGTGEEAGAPSRVQAVKPVALWSGVTKVGSDGRARVSFKIPQYQGKLRVMVVSAGPMKMGSNSTTVTVRSPLVTQTTLPRFLSAGDEFEVPVFVTNMTGSKQTITVTLKASNLPVFGDTESFRSTTPIKIIGKTRQTLTLAYRGSGRVVFRARARQQVGAATLLVKTQAGKYLTEEKLDVPFYPVAPRERRVQRIELKKGKLALGQYLQGWMPTTESTTFTVTNNPYGQVFGHLKYLIRYPYGCIEQTTSSTRPLLFLPNLMAAIDPAAVSAKGNVNKMIEHGINRVLSMQTPSGGFAYWPGQTAPNNWGTAYATHMLLDAQKLNYPVPKERLNDVLRYIERTLNSGLSATYGGYHAGRSTEAYLHYVLALAGRGRKARILRLIEQIGLPQTGEEKEQLYLLKAALYLSGDRRYERDLKNPDISAVSGERRNNWSFYSDRRRRGFILSIFGDLFGDDIAGERLAQIVAATLSQHRSYYYTTQELVWGITGLGKRVANLSGDFDPPVLRASGKVISPKYVPTKKNARDRSWSLYRASEYRSLTLDIKNKGKGKLYLIISSEGIRKGANYAVGGTGLQVTRRFYAIDGSSISPVGFQKLGGLVVVEVTISNTTSERIQNIALVDRLPAGWEVENPRLGRSRTIDWLRKTDLWQVDYMNVRDDRVEYFGALKAGESKKVVYMARAVTAGNFALPPVEAQAMYDPAIWARQQGQRIRILAPWTQKAK